MIHGDFCERFCGQEESPIQPISCDNTHSNKEVVFKAKLGSKHVFVKGFVDPEYHGNLIPLKSGDSLPSSTDFVAMVAAYLMDNFGFRLRESDVMPTLFPDVKISGDLDEATMNNMWSLIQDDEFVFLRFFAHLDVFPKLHGRCGNVYVVESLEPLPTAQKELEVDRYVKQCFVQRWSNYKDVKINQSFGV